LGLTGWGVIASGVLGLCNSIKEWGKKKKHNKGGAMEDSNQRPSHGESLKKVRVEGGVMDRCDGWMSTKIQQPDRR